MRFLSAYATDIGPRSTQQDLAGATPTRMVLADGMGGTRGGAQAAAAAVPAILGAATLEQGFTSARVAVAQVQRAAELRDAGTTVVAVEVQGQSVLAMHSGDSRAYLVHGSNVELLTVDQSIAGQLVKMGHLSLSEFLAGEGHRGLLGTHTIGEQVRTSRLLRRTQSRSLLTEREVLVSRVVQVRDQTARKIPVGIAPWRHSCRPHHL